MVQELKAADEGDFFYCTTQKFLTNGHIKELLKLDSQVSLKQQAVGLFNNYCDLHVYILK